MKTSSFLQIAGVAALLAAAPALAAPAIGATTHTAPDGKRTLVHEVLVDAPPAEVWAAISTAEGWRSWAVPVAWTPPGEVDVIETGYDASAKPGDPGTIRQRLLAAVPNHVLAFRTVKAPARFPHWEAYREVTSVFLLDPVGDRQTRVRLIGAGYPESPTGDAALAFFERGNAASLEWLRLRFVEGPADWAKRLGTRK